MLEKITYEELHKLYFLPYTFRIISQEGRHVCGM